MTEEVGKALRDRIVGRVEILVRDRDIDGRRQRREEIWALIREAFASGREDARDTLARQIAKHCDEIRTTIPRGDLWFAVHRELTKIVEELLSRALRAPKERARSISPHGIKPIR